MKNDKYLCYVFLFVPIILFLLQGFEQECDIWFLLSHGRYVLNHGFPHTDFLSMHSNLHFVMQQWLSSVIFYVPYKFLGNTGIYLLVFLTFIVILISLYKLSFKVCGKTKLSCIVTCVIGCLLEFGFITCRPMIFSTLIFIILLYIMECFIKKKDNIIYFLVLLSLLEVNLHASMWPILFVLLLPYVVYFFHLYFKNKDKSILKLLLVIVLMIIVGFINPYGLEAMTYSFKSYGISDINEFIWEMNGLYFSGSYAYINFFSYLTLIIALYISLIMIFSKRKVPIYKILLFFGTFYMALLNIRNISLFIICTIPLCSNFIRVRPVTDVKINVKIFVLIVVAFGSFMIIFNGNKYILADDHFNYKKILLYMNNHVSKDENIYTKNHIGGYFSYMGYKTYIDTRAEVYIKANNNKEDIFHEYYSLINGSLSCKKFLDKYNFKYLIVEDDEPLYSYLSNNSLYVLRVKTKHYYLFEKL